MVSPAALDWNRDGGDWPHRAASELVESGGREWLVQRFGAGPDMLLIHGTGASSHSWRHLAPHLAERFRVTTVDIPGHGFTTRGRMSDLSLHGMSRALGTLLHDLDLEPEFVVGHSAGAAILVQMRFEDRIAPRAIASLNGALEPFRGATGLVFPALARLLFLNPFAPRIFARRASPRTVTRLIEETGSAIDADGVELYRRLLSNTEHVSSALGMMANWNLDALSRRLGELDTPLLLMVGERDRAVAPDSARRVAERVPQSTLEVLSGLGHLAHEEDAETCARVLLDWASPRQSGASG